MVTDMFYRKQEANKGDKYAVKNGIFINERQTLITRIFFFKFLINDFVNIDRIACFPSLLFVHKTSALSGILPFSFVNPDSVKNTYDEVK